MNSETATHVTVNNRPVGEYVGEQLSTEIEQVRRSEIRGHRRPIRTHRPLVQHTPRQTAGKTFKELRAQRRERIQRIQQILMQNPKGVEYNKLREMALLTNAVISQATFAFLLKKAKVFRYRLEQRGKMLVSINPPPRSVKLAAGWRHRRAVAAAPASVQATITALPETDLYGSAAVLLRGLATVCERLSKNGRG